MAISVNGPSAGAGVLDIGEGGEAPEATPGAVETAISDAFEAAPTSVDLTGGEVAETFAPTTVSIDPAEPEDFEIPGALPLGGYIQAKFDDPGHKFESAKYAYFHAVQECGTQPRLDGTPEQNCANLQAWMNKRIKPFLGECGFEAECKPIKPGGEPLLFIRTNEDKRSGEPTHVSVFDISFATKDANGKHRAEWTPAGGVNESGVFVPENSKQSPVDLSNQEWLFRTFFPDTMGARFQTSYRRGSDPDPEHAEVLAKELNRLRFTKFSV